MKKSSPSPAPSKSQTTRQFMLGAAGGVVFAVLVATGVWALTRPKTEPAAMPVPAAAAMPAAAPAAPADHEGHDHADFKKTTVDELKAAVDRGEVTVLDVRDMDSYLAGHIPGSLHIPLSRVEGEIPYLPKGKPIVAYCTCPAEETSGAAAAILERGGIQASALVGGLGAWRDKGLPLASGQS